MVRDIGLWPIWFLMCCMKRRGLAMGGLRLFRHVEMTLELARRSLCYSISSFPCRFSLSTHRVHRVQKKRASPNFECPPAHTPFVIFTCRVAACSLARLQRRVHHPIIRLNLSWRKSYQHGQWIRRWKTDVVWKRDEEDDAVAGPVACATRLIWLEMIDTRHRYAHKPLAKLPLQLRLLHAPRALACVSGM
jgi:hypothetical protein